MKSRRETHGRKKRFPTKLLIGILFLLIVFGGSVNVAFADSDISTILNQWFNQKSSNAIEEIDQSIDKEKNKQTKRLEEELRQAIGDATDSLADFTKEEKENRTEKLRLYTDELIADFDIGDSNEKAEVGAELNGVVDEAIYKMNKIMTEKANNQSTTKDENDKTGEETEKDKNNDKDESTKADEEKEKDKSKSEDEAKDDKDNVKTNKEESERDED